MQAPSDAQDSHAPLLARALRGVGKGFLGLGFGRLLAIFLQILVSRWFGHTAFGHYFTGLTYCFILETILSLGLQKGAMRHVAVSRERGESGRVHTVVRAALLMPLPTGLLLVAVGLLLAPWLAGELLGEPELIPVLQRFSIAAMFLSILRIASDASRGFGSVGRAVTIEECLHPLLQLLIFLALAKATDSPLAAADSFLLATVLSAGAMTVVVLQQSFSPSQAAQPVPLGPVARSLLLYSLPLMPFGLLHMASTFMDVGMLNYFRNASDVGEYGAAARWPMLAATIANPVMLMFGPLFAAKHGINDIASIRTLYSAMSRWLLYLLLPVVVFLCMAAKPLIGLFGPDYQSSTPTALVILALGTLVSSFSSGAAILMIVSGRQKSELFCLLTGLLTNFLLNAALIPKFGIPGAAIATAAAGALTTLTRIALVKKLLGIHPCTGQFRRILSVVATCLAGVLLLSMIRNSLGAADTPWAFMASVLAMGVVGRAFLRSDDRCLLASKMLDSKTIHTFGGSGQNKDMP